MKKYRYSGSNVGAECFALLRYHNDPFQQVTKPKWRRLVHTSGEKTFVFAIFLAAWHRPPFKRLLLGTLGGCRIW